VARAPVGCPDRPATSQECLRHGRPRIAHSQETPDEGISKMTLLACNIIIPLLILIAFYVVAKFPVLMAALLCLLAPLLGSLAMVTVGELSKTQPNLLLVPSATLFFYIFFALPFFGLWVTDLGVVVWSLCVRMEPLRRMRVAPRLLLGAGLGLATGIVIAFAFYAAFSVNPGWPSQMTISTILSDSASMRNVALQGAVAGLACGPIVAWYVV
jgi:hypothetical protein